MTRVCDLLKDDIIYGFCIDTQKLEIYQVDHVTLTEVHFYTIIGDESFYMMFDLHKVFYFDKYLDVWTQIIHKLK